MAEVPSVRYHLEDYQALGISGVSIGSNDLTQLMLGVNRDNEALAELFDERDPAVLGAMHNIISTCRRLGLTSSICGQAPSVYADLCETLVNWGITSISVNPDTLELTRRLIAAAEQRVLLRRGTGGRGDGGTGGRRDLGMRGYWDTGLGERIATGFFNFESRIRHLQSSILVPQVPKSPRPQVPPSSHPHPPSWKRQPPLRHCDVLIKLISGIL